MSKEQNIEQLLHDFLLKCLSDRPTSEVEAEFAKRIIQALEPPEQTEQMICKDSSVCNMKNCYHITPHNIREQPLCDSCVATYDCPGCQPVVPAEGEILSEEQITNIARDWFERQTPTKSGFGDLTELVRATMKACEARLAQQAREIFEALEKEELEPIGYFGKKYEAIKAKWGVK